MLEQSRVMMAPLRYGAGLKGKITQALAAGLPVVTTAIGAEGLVAKVSEDSGCDPEAQIVLIAENAREMAVDAIRLYRDDELWRRLSGAGQEFIAQRCSPETVKRQLSRILDAEVAGVAQSLELSSTP